MSSVWRSEVGSMWGFIFSLSISGTQLIQAGPMSLRKCHGYGIISCGGVSSHLTFACAFSSPILSTCTLFPPPHSFNPYFAVFYLVGFLLRTPFRIITWSCLTTLVWCVLSYIFRISQGSFCGWQVIHHHDTLSLFSGSACTVVEGKSLGNSRKWQLPHAKSI